jgi:hypothetical protein
MGVTELKRKVGSMMCKVAKSITLGDDYPKTIDTSDAAKLLLHGASVLGLSTLRIKRAMITAAITNCVLCQAYEMCISNVSAVDAN